MNNGATNSNLYLRTKLLKIMIPAKSLSLLFCLFVVFGVVVPPVLCLEFADSNESVIRIETVDADGLFDYAGSGLSEAVKVNVASKYSEEAAPVKYETLWYHDGSGIGCNRYTDLDLEDSNSIKIHVIASKADKTSHVQAATNASLRILLDLYVSGHSISRIVVPDDRFASGAIAEMNRAGLYQIQDAEPDEMHNYPMLITLESEQSGKLYTLCQRSEY